MTQRKDVFRHIIMSPLVTGFKKKFPEFYCEAMTNETAISDVRMVSTKDNKRWLRNIVY